MSVIDDQDLLRLLTKVRERMDLDFSQYKEQTLLRRIDTRLSRCGLDSYSAYCDHLDAHPEEYVELVNAITINVTDFFRNPESFTAIRDVVIPEIFREKTSRMHRLIRVWSCGCSLGDEPYSLAMIFLEGLRKVDEGYSVSIFGTDIDREALEEAKHHVYKKDRLEAIDEGLLETYFDKNDNGDHVLKDVVRKMVMFKEHDVIHDRPIMSCDLILCRNLLIYFNKELQEETLLKLYECLNPGGFLVLGMCESLVGSAAKKFESVDNRLRIYRRPENAAAVENVETLSQQQIDRIIKELLGR